MIGKGDYEYTIPFYGVRRPQLMDLMWESRQEDIIEKYPQVTSDGESLSAEAFCNALYGGRGAHVFARVSPLHDNDGNIVGAIESIRDITVSKKMQQLIEAKNRELEQMLYIASHDLRSPLVNIDGYGRELEFSVRELRQALDMAPESLSEFTKVAQSHMQDITGALQYIRNSTTQMDALLKGILKLSRSGRASLSIGPLNMNELVAGVISAIEFQIREKGVDLHVSELPPCVGDAVQVTQVFSNLLGNALKYLDEGKAGSIGIDGIIKDGRSIYCVEDNGIGIDLAHQEKIFEVFHRLEPSKSEGEGLGLTIVRQILSRIDGDIWLESKPGEGSRFYVALPAAPEKGEINEGR
jgi:signal transduction histidine kinase